MTISLPRVFIGSSSESLHLALAVQSNLEPVAEVRIWNQDLFQTGNSALEDLLKLVKEFDYAVFIWSSDDAILSRGSNYFTARDNVILEAGMFYSALGKERVFLILPSAEKPKVPSDLAGINHLFFREPTDGNYRAALGTVSRNIQVRINEFGMFGSSLSNSDNKKENREQAPKMFKNVRDAWTTMKADCHEAAAIAIFGIRGLSAFGTDQSLVSFAEIEKFINLRKLRIILLSEDSRWLNHGFIQLRAYESIEIFKKELKASHDIIESAMAKLAKRLNTAKSGIKYTLGEPKFGMVITDKVAYVNTYAEHSALQVVDLPICRFEKVKGSLYGAFKRYFDDLWHNNSVPGQFQREYIDLEVSAGGIVMCEYQNKKFIALLRRHDGYWVLPKGHRMYIDNNLEETALREVSEETGLSRSDIYIDKPLGYYTYDEMAEQLNTTKVIHLYLMRCTKGIQPPLNSPDFFEAKWWDIAQSLPEMLYSYQKSYLHEVIEAEILSKGSSTN